MKKVKYKVAPNQPEELMYCRRVSEDGKIEIGVHRVMYGFRVRVGYVGDLAYELDYCAGSDHTFLEVLYALVLGALEEGVSLDKFPIQERKPYYNDPENFKRLIELAGKDYEKIYLTDPNTRINFY